ncbi:MAG: hypothetical protein K2X78_02665 [Burkholderiaceae bacterium]|nr:hypothetical protein [Burkholderiaceae bacterium]
MGGLSGRRALLPGALKVVRLPHQLKQCPARAGFFRIRPLMPSRFRKFQIKSFVMQSGERYGLLIDMTTGVPWLHPNLFVTAQAKNKSN